MRIEINNTTAIPVEEKFLKGIVEKIFRSESKKGGNLSIAFIGEKRMRSLNKKYRGKDRATDVLSFSQSGKIPAAIENKLEEEIIICLQAVKRNAARYNSTFKRELARVLIHGVLHLLGYDHEKSQKAAEEMRKKEDYYLSAVFKKRKAKKTK